MKLDTIALCGALGFALTMILVVVLSSMGVL